MSWTSPLLYQSVLSLLQLAQLRNQVAQAPAQGKSSETAEKKTGTPEKSANQAKSSYEETYEKEKKLCRSSTLGSKPTLYMNCLEEARRRLRNPPKPSPTRTPLERELASCEMRGKPVQVWQCKGEAPAKVERQLKEASAAAERESKLSPEQKAAERLSKALNACSMHSKPVQWNQCRVEAREKYGVK